MKEITPQHTKEILTEMCKRVGVDAADMDFNKPNWYWDHEWTENEEADFVVWLANFLRKNKYTIRGNRSYAGGYKVSNAIHEANKLVANYGWKIKFNNNESFDETEKV